MEEIKQEVINTVSPVNEMAGNLPSLCSPPKMLKDCNPCHAE